MAYGITRDAAFELISQHLENPNMIKHCLAAEAVMRALAGHFSEDPDKWGLAGLLHDLDAESQPDLTAHTRETEEVLTRLGVDLEIIGVIGMHNEQARDRQRNSTFEHALAAGETITGLITATALVYPDKKLASVKSKSVRKRIKEKAFAAGADRDIIRECETIGIPIDEFCDLCLKAMQSISDDLGL